jgi:NAD(P)H dehydrogenase (quinone)
MYAIVGITGQVGGAVARKLLADKRRVRAVLRDANRGLPCAVRGCEIARADLRDAASLTAAFKGVEGVFAMLPPIFDPSPDFPEARALIASLRSALAAASPSRVVCLSTVGAQAKRQNLLTQLTILEQELGELSQPVTFLRPAWFMENFAWDIAPARTTGVVSSFLQPLDRHFPMVATVDVGRVAAELLQDDQKGRRIVELEGPRRIAPVEVARALSEVLGRAVRADAVPRDKWEALFTSQGMKHPKPRIQMLDGFNEGWIGFEGGESRTLKGKIELKTVLELLAANGAGVAA